MSVELLKPYVDGYKDMPAEYYMGMICRECDQPINSEESCGKHDPECSVVEYPFNSLDSDCDELEDCEGSCEYGPDLFDPLDITYTVNSQGTLTGVELCVGFGGPNIYVDCTGHYITIKGYWGFSDYSVDTNIESASVVDYYEEYFHMTMEGVRNG